MRFASVLTNVLDRSMLVTAFLVYSIDFVLFLERI